MRWWRRGERLELDGEPFVPLTPEQIMNGPGPLESVEPRACARCGWVEGSPCPDPSAHAGPLPRRRPAPKNVRAR